MHPDEHSNPIGQSHISIQQIQRDRNPDDDVRETMTKALQIFLH
jgi:hypothetical protein